MKQDILASAINNALESNAIMDERVANAPKEPKIGNVYAAPVLAKIGIFLLLVKRHPDDENLWFALPYDMNSLVGTWDVAVIERGHDISTMTIRCGHGLWITTHELNSINCVLCNLIDDNYVSEANQRLAMMVGNGTPITKEEVDADIEYQEWIDEVTDVIESIVDVLRVVPFLSGWSNQLPTEPGQYWFCGDEFHGSMGSDYQPNSSPVKPEVKLIEARLTGNGLMYISHGQFVQRKQFDKEKRQAGWHGYWKKATIPQAPLDIHGYFQ